MTADLRAQAHVAIGCDCKLYSGTHDEICERITSALRAARNDALEAAEAELRSHDMPEAASVVSILRIRS